MKRKELLDHGRIRKLTEAETNAVVGGYSIEQSKPVNGLAAIEIAKLNVEGTRKVSISPSRKNVEVVPTAGVELATY